MEILSATPQNAIERVEKSANTLAGDFETFLSLLTTQLQQQDPLSPMDAEKFTSQLVQFSAVEQSIEMNRQLSELVGLMSADTTSAALSYLGHEVEVEGGAIRLGDTGSAEFSIDVPFEADSVALTILDENGKAVRSLDAPQIPGNHRLSWDGFSNTGQPLPAGRYQVVGEAIAGDGSALSITVHGGGLVEGIETIDGEQMLIVDGTPFAIDDVRSVRLTNIN